LHRRWRRYDEEGARRAVIVLNQVEPDGDGGVKVQQYVAVVKPDGTIGSPYEP
jgi:hypothetical protein